jgi:sporulation protein YlmC with PRC-barrel domain
MYEMKPGQWRATKLTGLAVYNTNNERIGDIGELIVDRDGKVAAVVIGVGGFLGMGEHHVAVPFEQVKWVDEPRASTVSGAPAPRNGATGSGTSAPATNVDRPATTTTTVDRQIGSTVTTTDRPATTTMDRPAATAPARDATRAAHRGFPDHAVVAMTKEQLKALPEVQYAR